MWAVVPGRRPLVRLSARTDGWNSELDWDIGEPRPARAHATRYDVDYAGGTVARRRRRGPDPALDERRDFFFNGRRRARSTTQDWRAVGARRRANAGASAARAASSRSRRPRTSLPDIVAPTGHDRRPDDRSTPASRPRSRSTPPTRAAPGSNPASIRWTIAGPARPDRQPRRASRSRARASPRSTVTLRRQRGQHGRGDGRSRDRSTKPAANVLPVSFTGPGNTADGEDQGPLHPRDHEGHDHAARGRDRRGLRASRSRCGSRRRSASWPTARPSCASRRRRRGARFAKKVKLPPQEGRQDEEAAADGLASRATRCCSKSSKKLTLVVKK